MKAPVFILLLFLVLFACTKDGKNITVQGRVYNPVTGEGISDCEIRLVKESLELPGGNKTVLTVYPDANGYFELSHTSIGARYVGCFFDNEKYDEIGWIQDGQNIGSSLVPVKRGKFTYLDCQAVQYGNLVYHFRNDNCQGPNDTLILYYDGSEVGSDDALLGELTRQYGCADITGNPIKYSMGERYYHWTVIRNGVSQTFYQTVYVPANSTTTLEVFY